MLETHRSVESEPYALPAIRPQPEPSARLSRTVDRRPATQRGRSNATLLETDGEASRPVIGKRETRTHHGARFTTLPVMGPVRPLQQGQSERSEHPPRTKPVPPHLGPLIRAVRLAEVPDVVELEAGRSTLDPRIPPPVAPCFLPETHRPRVPAQRGTRRVVRPIGKIRTLKVPGGGALGARNRLRRSDHVTAAQPRLEPIGIVSEPVREIEASGIGAGSEVAEMLRQIPYRRRSKRPDDRAPLPQIA